MVAALVVAAPATFVNTALTFHPFSRALRLPVANVGDVAPVKVAQVDPPSTEYCHCTVGAGVPLAAAVKVRD
jgi:hypothetical protein